MPLALYSSAEGRKESVLIKQLTQARLNEVLLRAEELLLSEEDIDVAIHPTLIALLR
jgi:hypothetical protein